MIYILWDIGTALTLKPETRDLFIIASTEGHLTTNLITATRAQLIAGVEQWAEKTIKWWADDLPIEPLTSARAVKARRWEDVTYDEQTAEVVLEFTGEIAAVPADPFWATVVQYLDTVRVTTDADTVVSVTRAMFQEDQPANTGHAFFPGNGGNEQLIDALSDAGWTFTYIDGHLHYAATAPNGTRLAYIDGDLELEPCAERPDSLTIPATPELWRVMDSYVANREALAEAGATGEDTEPLSEATDDMANGIAIAAVDAASND